MAHPGDLAWHPRRRPRNMILAIETSCDDTCAAVITRAGEIRSNVVSSQGVHSRFGGVVPEWASRHHLELVNLVVDQALEGSSLDEVELIAVTQGPGLVGALLVGVATAKGLAASRRLPLARGRSPAGPRGRELPRRLRAAVRLPAGLGRAHAAGEGDVVRRLRDAGPDARRRRGRGLRQGRAAARARLSGRAGAVEAGAGGRSGARSSSRPARASPGSTSPSRA